MTDRYDAGSIYAEFQDSDLEQHPSAIREANLNEIDAFRNGARDGKVIPKSQKAIEAEERAWISLLLEDEIERTECPKVRLFLEKCKGMRMTLAEYRKFLVRVEDDYGRGF